MNNSTKPAIGRAPHHLTMMVFGVFNRDGSLRCPFDNLPPITPSYKPSVPHPVKTRSSQQALMQLKYQQAVSRGRV